MADILDMARINSLPQLTAVLGRGSEWPVHDIDVETGLMRIDVVGKLEIVHYSDVLRFRDADGGVHDPDEFYLEGER